jgi:hypothetical protein
MHGNCIGMIHKNFLIVLVERHHWYTEPNAAEVHKRYKTIRNKQINKKNILGWWHKMSASMQEKVGSIYEDTESEEEHLK